jgi:hypothetical protein
VGGGGGRDGGVVHRETRSKGRLRLHGPAINNNKKSVMGRSSIA